jgi:hypothetical protein
MLPVPVSIPPAFWADERNRLLALFLPKMEALAMAGAVNAALKLRGVGITFDPMLANAAAAAWARVYTDALLQRLQTTDQAVVGKILANWVATPGATMGDLVNQLAPAFANNTARADLIAITETTRATAEGEAIVYREAGIGAVLYNPPGHPGCRCWTAAVRRDGQNLVVWKTNRDEVVCRQKLSTPWGTVEGCRALHNTVISAGELAGQKI